MLQQITFLTARTKIERTAQRCLQFAMRACVCGCARQRLQPAFFCFFRFCRLAGTGFRKLTKHQIVTSDVYSMWYLILLPAFVLHVRLTANRSKLRLCRWLCLLNPRCCAACASSNPRKWCIYSVRSMCFRVLRLMRSLTRPIDR